MTTLIQSAFDIIHSYLHFVLPDDDDIIRAKNPWNLVPVPIIYKPTWSSPVIFISNFKEIHEFLNVDKVHLMLYLRLQYPWVYLDVESNTLAIKTKHFDLFDFCGHIQGYIKKYIMCKYCGSSETTILMTFGRMNCNICHKSWSTTE